jgi:6-phosphogluconolactonase
MKLHMGWRALCATGSLLLSMNVAHAHERDVVYTMTNASAGNEIAVFKPAYSGQLVAAGKVSTQGLGTGAGLGSQGALTLSRHGQFLFAVNAGSNDVSVFAVGRRGDLYLTSKTPSGGTRPISVAVHGNLVYVLNAGESGNISGFKLGYDGKLTPIAKSTLPLSGSATAPAQVGFSRDGSTLVVTERATNLISLYEVDEHGMAQGPKPVASAGKTPFGFTFDRRNNLLVSEANGGPPNISAISSYDLDADSLNVISPSVTTTNQQAACWVEVTPNSRYAYTTNTASGTLTGYRIGRDGMLTILTPDGKTGDTGTGSGPIDLAIDRSGNDMYVLTAASANINHFQIQRDGSLNLKAPVAGIPASATGIAVGRSW